MAGLGFALAVDDRPLLRRLHLVSGALALIGATMAVVQLRHHDWGAAAYWPWSVSILVAALAGIVAVGARVWRGWCAGVLEVDRRGVASWRSGAAHSAVAVQPHSWYRGAGMIWLQWAQPLADGRRSVVLGRGQLPDPDWRAVSAWLVWLERGPRPTRDPGAGA